MTGLPAWARVGPRRRAHIERVARLIGTWAAARREPDAERDRWVRAAYLHDALRDAPASLLVDLAGNGAPHVELLHGPAAAARAAAEGETDAGVLDAVRYHSVGYAGWDAVGRMLYLADYLEPGRRFRAAARRALAKRVPRAPARILRLVAAERIGWLLRSEWPLPPETVAFWNALTRGS